MFVAVNERDMGEKKRKNMRCPRYRRVYKYDLYGKLVSEYADLETAAQDSGISIDAVRLNLIGQTKVSRDGFIYRWSKLQ